MWRGTHLFKDQAISKSLWPFHISCLYLPSASPQPQSGQEIAALGSLLSLLVIHTASAKEMIVRPQQSFRLLKSLVFPTCPPQRPSLPLTVLLGIWFTALNQMSPLNFSRETSSPHSLPHPCRIFTLTELGEEEVQPQARIPQLLTVLTQSSAVFFFF